MTNTPRLDSFNAPNAPAPQGGYSQAMQVSGHTRLLFVSGQIPEDRSGEVPESFEAQAKLVWANIHAQLRAASMDTNNIVKVTTFLSSRSYASANGEARRVALGAHAPALTVIISEIFDARWLLEIEVVAAG